MALDSFEVLTPAGRLLQRLAQTAWPALVSVESDLPSELQIISVENARFVQGGSGLGSAEARIRAHAGEADPLEADLLISLDAGVITEARLRNVRIGGSGGRDVSATPNVAAEATRGSADESLQRLRGVLGS